MDVVARLSGFIEGIEATTAARDAADLFGAVDLIAVGWATVDFDRALPQLSEQLSLPPDGFAPAPDDLALGARCVIAAQAVPAGRRTLDLVVLEPATEGRLAATLARADEGPAAAWLATNDLAAATLRARAFGIPVAASRDGPLGPANLLLDTPMSGPHRFLVGRPAGTIRR